MILIFNFISDFISYYKKSFILSLIKGSSKFSNYKFGFISFSHISKLDLCPNYFNVGSEKPNGYGSQHGTKFVTDILTQLLLPKQSFKNS